MSREALSEMAEMAAWSSKLGTFDWDVLSLSEEGVKASVVLMFEALGLLVEEKAAGEGERDVGSLCGRGLGAASMGSVVVRGSTGAVEGILARRMSNKGSRSDNSRYVSARRDASVATGERGWGGVGLVGATCDTNPPHTAAEQAMRYETACVCTGAGAC